MNLKKALRAVKDYFNLNYRKFDNTRFDTLISRRTHVKGPIEFSGVLKIEGKVSGEITCSQQTGEDGILVAPGAQVISNLAADFIYIDGYVSGNVIAEKGLVIGSKAVVDGDVIYHTMQIFKGAVINGKIKSVNQVSRPDTAVNTGVSTVSVQRVPAGD